MRKINIYVTKLNVYFILDFIIGLILFYNLHKIKYIGIFIFILIFSLSINNDFMNFINKRKNDYSLCYYREKIFKILENKNLERTNCNFHLVINDKLEVWTEPYNNIYVSSDILRLDEKIVLGMLGHELGHIYSGHLKKIATIINKNIAECILYVILFNLINILNLEMSPLLKFVYTGTIITMYILWIYLGINLFYENKLNLELEADSFAINKLGLKEELLMALEYYNEVYLTDKYQSLEPNLESIYLNRRIETIKK